MGSRYLSQINDSVKPSTWRQTATATDAVATATQAAEADKRHFITAVMVSLSASTDAATLTITGFGSAAFTFEIIGNNELVFPSPLQCPLNTAAVAAIAAGGAGVVGIVTIIGYSE